MKDRGARPCEPNTSIWRHVFGRGGGRVVPDESQRVCNILEGTRINGHTTLWAAVRGRNDGNIAISEGEDG